MARWLAAGLVLCQAAGSAFGSPASAESPVKVFILAGQSNMEGYGGLRTLDELGDHPTLGGLLDQIRHRDGSFKVPRLPDRVWIGRGDEEPAPDSVRDV